MAQALITFIEAEMPEVVVGQPEQSLLKIACVRDYKAVIQKSKAVY
jgi:hypothetical protein